ncbi:bidirectional sugar transporter SWEET16 isoform X1 [Populus alba]|uniref:bidirectional sugar transporter SWEET16 isoform X1 n=2 Tax=Populus alba TaxID=43335 RepID=UPI001588C046|nr:bidirectional sugar transporter SWEET16-like isoform X1 [Populus alba]
MANTIFIVGVLGNIISSLAYLSPLKTFWRIVKNRSTEDFSSIPYICTLMNAILWIYYGITKPDSFLIATINGFGAVTQIVYILIFLVFISPRMRAKTALLVGLLDVGFAAAAISFTHFMFQGDVRIVVVGFICDCSGMLVYASPLAAMQKTVITTKSVEFMPFLLSFAILLNGGFWTLYALLAKDILVGIPNGIGLLLGIAQLILYGIYHRYEPLKEASDNLEDGLQNESLIPACDSVS